MSTEQTITVHFLGHHVNQNEDFIEIFESLLWNKKFARIIELGTFTGNLSVYFKLFCINKNAEFYTFDIEQYPDSPVKQYIKLNDSFHKMDILENLDYIGNLVKSEGQTVLFCDNGNKIKEFNGLRKYLKRGDLIGVHDWGIELEEGDINTNGLKKLFEDQKTQIAFWVKE